MRKKAIAGAIAVALAAAIYFVFFAGTDEEKIRGTIERLTKALQVSDGGNPVLKAARVHSELGAVLTDDAHVTVPELGTQQGLESISDMSMKASMAYRSAEVDVHDLQIKIDDAKITAKVGGRAHVRATLRSGEEQRDQRAVDFLLRKSEGRWKIASITVWEK